MAFFHILTDDFGQLAGEFHPMPFGTFLLFAVLVFPGFVGRHRKGAVRVAGLEILDFRIFADGADEDDFIDATHDNAGCLADMVALHEQTGAWSLAVEEVPREQTDKYGVVSLAAGSNRMTAMVEKPKPADAPSNLAVVGRYVLPGAVFAALAEVRPGAGGEIQLTDGIAALLANYDIRAHRFAGVRYDCGSKLGYAKANMALALRDAEMGAPLKAWLQAEVLR